jgi:hypothetical protein
MRCQSSGQRRDRKLYNTSASTLKRRPPIVPEFLSQRLDRDDSEEWHDGLPAAELESDELPEVLSIEANDSDVPPDLTEGA